MYTCGFINDFAFSDAPEGGSVSTPGPSPTPQPETESTTAHGL